MLLGVPFPCTITQKQLIECAWSSVRRGLKHRLLLSRRRQADLQRVGKLKHPWMLVEPHSRLQGIPVEVVAGCATALPFIHLFHPAVHGTTCHHFNRNPLGTPS